MVKTKSLFETPFEISSLVVEGLWGRSRSRRMLPKEAAMVKLFVTETTQRVALEGMQMMGGDGYSSEYDMERLVRSALVSMIYGEVVARVRRRRRRMTAS